MSERFFIDSPIGDSPTAELLDAEAHHLAKVMRAKIGDEILVFDGCGCEFTAQVTAISKAKVSVTILARSEVNRESPVDLTLAVALPKGDRQRFLIEKLVELGVRRFIPLETKRGVAEPGESAMERLRRQVLEASKQCERNRLMEIAEPLSLAQLVQQTPSDAVRLIAHPGCETLHAASISAESPIIVAIGPEGGFTDEEIASAQQANWQVVSLGPRILRVETAAMAFAAVLGNLKN